MITFFADITFDEDDNSTMVPDDYDEVDERVTTEQPAATTASIAPRTIVYRTFDQLKISQSAHHYFC